MGHLFQDRYKSEIVDNDGYLLELSKYIHNNPVKAGIVQNASEYRWSSFRQYIDGRFPPKYAFLSMSQILGMLSDKQTVAQKEYYEYVTNSKENQNLTLRKGFLTAEDDNEEYLSIINEAKEKLNNLAFNKGLTVEELIVNKEERDVAIKKLRKNTGLTLKQIGELMGGLSESRISRISRR